jgi:hypothetical protein
MTYKDPTIFIMTYKKLASVNVCFCRFGASSAYAGCTPSPATRGSSTAGREQQPRPVVAGTTPRRHRSRPRLLYLLTWRRRVGRGKALQKTTTRLQATTGTAADADTLDSSGGWHRKKWGSSTLRTTGQNSWTGFNDHYDAGNSFFLPFLFFTFDNTFFYNFLHLVADILWAVGG